MFIVMFLWGAITPPDSLRIDPQGLPCVDSATCWTRIIQPESPCVRALDYDPQGTLRREQGFRSRTCTVLEGPAVYFDTRGRKFEEGTYRSGRRTGEWLLYDTLRGTLMERCLYKGLDSIFRARLDTRSGFTEAEGWETLSGGRSGKWIRYRFRTADTEWVNLYHHGLLHGRQQQFWPNGRLRRQEEWKSGKRTSAAAWDSLGRKIRHRPAYEAAAPPVKRFRAYILAQAPELSACLIRGDITIRVTVNAYGRPGPAAWNGVNDNQCTAALRKALRKLLKRTWKPARIEGRAVDGVFTYTLRDYAPKD